MLCLGWGLGESSRFKMTIVEDINVDIKRRRLGSVFAPSSGILVYFLFFKSA